MYMFVEYPFIKLLAENYFHYLVSAQAPAASISRNRDVDVGVGV